VASLLGLSEQRIYQLDEELRPEKLPRGTKMVTRLYARSVVDEYMRLRVTDRTPYTDNRSDKAKRP
jgi:predicted DNA-binding transcriptional regulator AlpA